MVSEGKARRSAIRMDLVLYPTDSSFLCRKAECMRGLDDGCSLISWRNVGLFSPVSLEKSSDWAVSITLILLAHCLASNGKPANSMAAKVGRAAASSFDTMVRERLLIAGICADKIKLTRLACAAIASKPLEGSGGMGRLK